MSESSNLNITALLQVHNDLSERKHRFAARRGHRRTLAPVFAAASDDETTEADD